MINVCYISDSNYVDLLQYSLKSLLDTRGLNDKYTIYILCNHMSLVHLHQLEAMSHNNVTIKVVNCNNVLPKAFDKYGAKKSAILKFYLDKILDIDKVLYLDCDLVVKQDVAQIYQTDLNGMIIGACPDDIYYTKENYSKAWISTKKDTLAYKEVKEEIILNRDKTYINSGVMLVDLAKMRESGIGDKLIEYRLTHETFFAEGNPSMDQDTFNLLMSDLIHVLPVIYNYLCIYDKKYTKEQIGVTEDEIVIKHFSQPSSKQETLDWMIEELNYKLPKTQVNVDYIKHFMSSFYTTRGRFANIGEPTCLSEIWMAEYLKQNSFKEIYYLADKVMVRDYVKKKGFEHILTKVYGIFDSAEDIDFDVLPEKFVLKCSIGCGLNLVCTDKKSINVENWRRIAAEWLHKKRYNPYLWEEHYNISKPQLIVEEYIEPAEEYSIPDGYDIFCHYGQPFAIISWTCKRGGYISRAWYDLPWTFRGDYVYDQSIVPVEKPVLYDQLIETAKALSEDLPFARIDLYQSSDRTKIYFGEVTLTSDAMIFGSVTEECQNNLAEKIKELDSHCYKK